MGEHLSVYQHADAVADLAGRIRHRHPEALAAAVRLARAIDVHPDTARPALLVAAHQHLVHTVLATDARPSHTANDLLTVAFYDVRGLDWMAETVRVRTLGPGRYRLWRSDGATGTDRPVAQAAVDACAQQLATGAGL